MPIRRVLQLEDGTVARAPVVRETEFGRKLNYQARSKSGRRLNVSSADCCYWASPRQVSGSGGWPADFATCCKVALTARHPLTGGCPYGRNTVLGSIPMLTLTNLRIDVPGRDCIFPACFPVTRESSGGDRFAPACIHHHAFADKRDTKGRTKISGLFRRLTLGKSRNGRLQGP